MKASFKNITFSAMLIIAALTLNAQQTNTSARTINTVEWRLDSYCVFYYERKRCTYLWRVKSDNLFAHHVYQDKNVSPPYAVVVTSFDAKKISGGKKGIRK